MSALGRWNLPIVWQWANANEFANVVGGGTPKNAKDETNYIDHGVPWLTPADLSGYSATYIERGARDLSEKGFASCSARMLPRGSVLLSSRAPVGYCVVAANDICTNQGFKSFALCGDQLVPEFLRYYLIGSKRYLESEASGTTFRELSGSRVAQLQFPIAPANEQRRIVSRIDELFSRIEEGEQALKWVAKLVERYRQSVLKDAVTGELTRDWREARKRAGEPVASGEALLARILKARRAAWEQAELAKLKAKGKTLTDERWKDKYNEPAPPDTTGLPELPEGWVWASMDQIGVVSGGLTKNQRRREYGTRRPYLRVANVYANRLDLEEVQTIGIGDSEMGRVLLEKDDLLVVEGNGSIEQIGRVAIWDGSIAGCVHQNHIIKVRCTELLPSWYVLIWCLSPHGREHIRRVASSTAGLHTLSLSKVESLPVPVPTPGELAFIRDRFDETSATVLSQRQELSRSLTTSSALRRSILKAAFSGQLVPQDPNDEPASKLLERIAGERASAATPRERTKKIA